MADLSQIPMSDLLGEAMRRPSEMLRDDGFLEDEAFKVADHLAPRLCVDGAPVRRNDDGELELMAIHRISGPYAGKLCLIGGYVGRTIESDGRVVPESISEALGRHFMTDLGFSIEPVVSWEQAQFIGQDMRPVEGRVREGFTPNPAARHVVAVRYLVNIIGGESSPDFGATKHGGQEADDVLWFTQDEMPEPDNFGYAHDLTYAALFPIARGLLDS